MPKLVNSKLTLLVGHQEQHLICVSVTPAKTASRFLEDYQRGQKNWKYGHLNRVSTFVFHNHGSN